MYTTESWCAETQVRAVLCIRRESQPQGPWLWGSQPWNMCHMVLAGVCLELSVGWDWEKSPIPLLPHGNHTPAQQGSSWAYLFRSVHAVPGFVFQEILFSKVTFATLGTFKWLLSSVFPWGMQIQNPITACQQHLHKQAQITGKGEVGTSPHPHSATIHSCPKAAFMLLLSPPQQRSCQCPLRSTEHHFCRAKILPQHK